MTIQVSWSRPAGVLVASVSGRVDSGSSAALQSALDEGIEADEQALVLDCRHLSYMSSAGLRVLLTVAKRFRGSGQSVGLCNLSESILAVVSASGFDKVIPVHATWADAIDAVGGAADGGVGAVYSTQAGETPIPMRNAINFAVVSENIADITGYTIEKYEYDNEDIPFVLRAKVDAEIKAVLWQQVEVMKERRKKALAEMFRKAAATLEDVLGRST